MLLIAAQEPAKPFSRMVSPMGTPVGGGLPSMPMGWSLALYSMELAGSASASRASAVVPVRTSGQTQKEDT